MTEERGPVTFLMTDIERSSGHWERSETEMAARLEEHDAITRAAVERHGGRLFKHTGDGAAAVFALPAQAVAAAVDLQREMADRPLRVRVGIHTGVAQSRDGDYFGLAVTRCARLMGLGHGRQILASAATADLSADAMPAGVTLVNLGSQVLRGLARPEHVFQLAAAGLESDFAPLQSNTVEHTLPAARTELVGRQREIDQVRELVLGNRLVTLTGIGGCGKTRLATEAAFTLLDQFSGGTFFVDLSATGDEAHMAADVASALQLRLGGGSVGVDVDPLREVVAFLADRDALVVLDNCEHLIDAAADLADTLLSRCPRLRLLATSREALEVEGEQSYRVPSLQLPDGGATGGEAVELFAQRAAAARSGFTMNPGNEEVVAEICRRLDGIPLAIELAAAQVGHLDVVDVLARLDDRFQLLVGGRRRAQRQQTLQAAIDWSYDLLNDDERALLRRLSVFAGGFTLPAVEGAFGRDLRSIVRLLASLVSKSLVVVDEVDGRARYRLLESIRLYAADRLVSADEATAARDAHRNWFLSRAERRSFDAAMLALRFTAETAAEHDNHRVALEWSRSQGDAEQLARHFSQLAGMWWFTAFYEEGEGWYQSVLGSMAELDAELAARVLMAGSVVAMVAADPSLSPSPEARADGQRARVARAQAIAGGDLPYGPLWTVPPRMLENPVEARDDLQRFLRWPRRAEFPGHERMARESEGIFCWLERDLDAAAGHFEALVREADWEDVYFSEYAAAFNLFVTRLMQHRDRDFDLALEALRLAAGALDAASPVAGLQFPLLLCEAYAHAVRGDADTAVESALAVVALVRRTRIPLAIGDCAVALGALAYHRGEIDAAHGLVSSAGPASPRGRITNRMPAGYSLLLHYQRRVARAAEREGIDTANREILDPEDSIDAELARLGVSA